MATMEEEQAGRGPDGELGTRAGDSRPLPATVVVAGAGVSGCACAAALALEGLRVTLVNSAMDRVGLPAYGPDLIGATEGWRDVDAVFHGLPEPLRAVWIRAATMPASGEAVLNIDRRKISIETKMALERLPGLEFRQGFVTGLRLVAGSDGLQGAQCGDGGTTSGASAEEPTRRPRVEVETIFGEIFEADAVVVAVGLSLGGSIDTGAETMHAGRYGEPESEGLHAALEALGAEFRETVLDVGPRTAARSATALGWLPAEDSAEPLVELRVEGPVEPRTHTAGEKPLLPAASDLEPDSWPAGYPPAPHWQSDLMVHRIVMAPNTTERGDNAGLPVLSPDGAATAEVYLAPESAFAAEMAVISNDEVTPMASRMAMTVRGLAVVGVGDTGRMLCGGEPGPVWVVGRSAGARDYAASLSSGLRAARDIACSLSRLAVAHPPIAAAGGRERGA